MTKHQLPIKTETIFHLNQTNFLAICIDKKLQKNYTKNTETQVNPLKMSERTYSRAEISMNNGRTTKRG